MHPKTLQHLKGHSDISLTMNTYTHLELKDAQQELQRMEQFNAARAEMESTLEQPVISKRLFRIV